MPEIAAHDWLDHHSGRTAQDCAVRLATASHTAMPSDRKLQELVGEQILTDLLSFALHTRKLMERRNVRDVTVSDDPLWPPSSVKRPTMDLWKILGLIIHARKIEICWETPELSSNPYKGREPRFAGSVTVESDKGTETLPIGAIVASFIGSLLRKPEFEEKQGSQ